MQDQTRCMNELNDFRSSIFIWHFFLVKRLLNGSEQEPSAIRFFAGMWRISSKEMRVCSCELLFHVQYLTLTRLLLCARLSCHRAAGLQAPAEGSEEARVPLARSRWHSGFWRAVGPEKVRPAPDAGSDPHSVQQIRPAAALRLARRQELSGVHHQGEAEEPTVTSHYTGST